MLLLLAPCPEMLCLHNFCQQAAGNWLHTQSCWAEKACQSFSCMSCIQIAEVQARLACLGRHLAPCFIHCCPCLQLWKLTQMVPSVLIGILAGACWSNDVRVAKTAVQALASVTHCLLAAGAERMPYTGARLALHAGSKSN